MWRRRRSSPLPLVGEALAGRATFYWTPEAGYGAKERAFSVQTKADRHASGSPFGGAGGRKPD